MAAHTFPGNKELRQFLVDHFNLREFRALAFDLDVNHEEMPHTTVTDLSRELIAHFKRRGELDLLVKEAVKRRPNADFTRYSTDIQPEKAQNSPVVLDDVKTLPIATTIGDNFIYDVFISYDESALFALFDGDKLVRCQPEQSNLCRLIRQLVDAGFRVNGAFRAPLGYPSILFSEDAVQESRYILLAFSQAYLKDSYADFENLIAQRVNIEERQYRVIPVLLEDCNPSLRFRGLPILKMFTNEQFALNFERLVIQLRQPPVKRP